MRSAPRLLLFVVALWLTPVALPAADEPMAVSTELFNGYTRVRLPDRSFQPEFYIFGEGGCWTRPIADPAMDRLQFPQIARTVAGPLAKMNYRPTTHPGEASLLILVFWGSTEGSASVGSERPEEQAMLDVRNAQILGYTDKLSLAQFAPQMSFAQDLRSEIAQNRYFVVLQAYDNATALKQRKLKPLWTTRISVTESGEFAPQLERMLWGAAHYFGQATDGLRRNLTRETTVELGPLKVIETVPPK